jgi:hypothetical protein
MDSTRVNEGTGERGGTPSHVSALSRTIQASRRKSIPLDWVRQFSIAIFPNCPAQKASMKKMFLNQSFPVTRKGHAVRKIQCYTPCDAICQLSVTKPVCFLEEMDRSLHTIRLDWVSSMSHWQPTCDLYIRVSRTRRDRRHSNFCVWPQVLPPAAYELAVVCIVDANE